MSDQKSSQINNVLDIPFTRRRALLAAGGLGLAASSLGTFGFSQSAAGNPLMNASKNLNRNFQVDQENISMALSQLDAIVADAQERTGVPGIAVCVIHNDEVPVLEGYGVVEVGMNRQIGADTIFQLASVSKCFASTVVAGLIGQEYVNWDSRISDLDPSFEMYEPYVTREVTIRDMFSHRSGLPDHAGDLLEDIGYDRSQILHRLRYQKPSTSFRSTYNYTNFGLTTAAEAAAAAAGMSWEEASAKVLYDPLRMTSTSSLFQDYIDSNRRTPGHVRDGDTWVAKHTRAPDAQSPAGGVSSSIRDLSKWLRLQLGNGMYDGEPVIDGTALAESHRPQIVIGHPEDPNISFAGFYGLGWNVNYQTNGLVRLGHSGAFALGASTAVSLLPAANLGMGVLTNAMPVGVAEAIIASFLDLVQYGEIRQDYIELIGEQFKAVIEPAYDSNYDSPPDPASPALAQDVYIGRYHNDLYGMIEIADQDGELSLFLGPDLTPFPMQHYDRDTYLYQPAGENAGGLSAVTFSIGPDQQATQVAIQIFNVDGEGIFARVD